MADLGRFDGTDRAYPMEGGRVAVDVASETSLCPTGLGQIGEGRDAVTQIRIRFNAPEAARAWLHVTWDPGESGVEQFEVAANGGQAVKSRRVDGEATPRERVRQAFPVATAKGANDIVMRYLSGDSGDGLRFRRLALATSAAPLTGQTISPKLAFPTLMAYSSAIGEPGVMIDTPHVRIFAPKRAEEEANVIAGYLVRAYDELFKIVGVHTEYKIVIWHFPEGSEHGWGGTSPDSCLIEYSYPNLMLARQEEWQRYKVPHVSGYIEEMAHNFVNASGARFGWEMIGWSLGARVTETVAGNPVHARAVAETRKAQAATFARYKALGNTVPSDLPYNQCDRIHAHVLWQCEKQYGDSFWRDFFAEIRKEGERLKKPVSGTNDERDDYRNSITVECFDRLERLNFRKRLADAGISATVYVRSLHPEKQGWNRKLQ
jgi:hypothetical protein